jgi:hypothetical protein
MRSGLQPVAISCHESDYHRPFPASIDVRAPSENASDSSNALRMPILCKITNVAELAFSEIRRRPIGETSPSSPGGLLSRTALALGSAPLQETLYRTS